MLVNISDANNADELARCIEQAKMNKQMPADMQPATNKYQTFKAELDEELNRAAGGFVKIGYLLKKARDTDVLEESGYKSVTEFAKMEYGLTADVVSRYIAINDRFAEDGYSDRLASKYCNYGLAKLQEMLTLPAAIVEELSPALTREEIQTIKKEYKAEQEISDLEIAMEAADEEIKQAEKRQQEEDRKEAAAQTENGINTRPDKEFEPKNNLEKMLYAYFEEYPNDYISCAVNARNSLSEILAPSGYRVITNRIAGEGKIMLTMTSAGITLVNMRTGISKKYTWADANVLFDEDRWGYELSYDCEADAENAKKRWECLYKKPFPETKKEPEQQVASASPKQDKKDRHKKKENRVTAIKPKKEAGETGTEGPRKEEPAPEENFWTEELALKENSRSSVQESTVDKPEVGNNKALEADKPEADNNKAPEADDNKALEADSTPEESDTGRSLENEKIAPVQTYSEVKYKVQINELARQVYETSAELQELSVSDDPRNKQKIEEQFKYEYENNYVEIKGYHLDVNTEDDELYLYDAENKGIPDKMLEAWDMRLMVGELEKVMNSFTIPEKERQQMLEGYYDAYTDAFEMSKKAIRDEMLETAQEYYLKAGKILGKIINLPEGEEDEAVE